MLSALRTVRLRAQLGSLDFAQIMIRPVALASTQASSHSDIAASNCLFLTPRTLFYTSWDTAWEPATTQQDGSVQKPIQAQTSSCGQGRSLLVRWFVSFPLVAWRR